MVCGDISMDQPGPSPDDPVQQTTYLERPRQSETTKSMSTAFRSIDIVTCSPRGS